MTGYCNNPAPPSNHCYAEIDWGGHTGGSNTLINPYGALYCYGCTGFIDNETWFSDPNSSQCKNTQYGSCWVEAGVSTWPASDSDNCNQGHDSTCLFWADNRPNPGSYHEHPLYNFGADGVNLYFYLIYITIVNNDSFSSSGSNWDVNTNIYYNSKWTSGPDGESTNNSMNGDDITIGSELSDSKGSADDFYFQDNQWMDGSGNFRFQTTTGSNDGTHPPPHGVWSVNPCNCQNNTGGAYQTYD